MEYTYHLAGAMVAPDLDTTHEASDPESAPTGKRPKRTT